jgi:hypothetical protein
VISIKRSDDQPFWIEDKGDYTVETRYDPDLDTGFSCRIRIEANKEGRVYFVDNYRCTEDDPAVIWRDMVSKYGFVNIPVTQMLVGGSARSGFIRYAF